MRGLYSHSTRHLITNVDVYQVVHSREGELIYLGTQSVLLQTGLLITKAEFPASPQQPLFITGRVEFFDMPRTAGKDGDTRKDEVPRWMRKFITICLSFIVKILAAAA